MKQIPELIDSLHLDDFRNELHPSIFDDNETYNMLIVRIPVVEEALASVSLGFIISDDKSYFYNKEKDQLEALDNLYMDIHKRIDKQTDKLLKSFVKYQEIILDMEESLYSDERDAKFLNNWLSIKLEILRIERILVRTTNTMSEFIEFYKDVDDFPMNHYADLHEHLERTMRSATLQLSKLDYLYSFYNAKSNDKMNKMIYMLTIVSVIFLPLNLIVGFFGMNTTGLPFSTGEIGTYYAIALMLSLVIITPVVVQIWRKKIES